jgi:6-pyruvoyltetrahydropterin/6-carboxytetrahydropterin synthase
MRHYSTKTYGHEQGLSACFRQWKAKSHCRLFHGYALSFAFKFSAIELNENNWVLDFGALKPVKAWLVDNFDHKLVVAQDDPEIHNICDLEELGLADVMVVDATGCEAFAELAFEYVEQWLVNEGHAPRVKVESVEVREHAGNSAIYSRD